MAAPKHSQLRHQAREIAAPYAALVDEWHTYAAKLEIVCDSRSVTENERAMASDELAALHDKIVGVQDQLLSTLPAELREQPPVRNLAAALDRLAMRLNMVQRSA